MIIEKFIKGLDTVFMPNPKEKRLINSLSFSNLTNVVMSPKIITKGIMIVIKLGIKKKDRYKIVIKSTWIKFVRDINLVNCNNQEIDKNMKKIKSAPFKISKKIYLFILLMY